MLCVCVCVYYCISILLCIIYVLYIMVHIFLYKIYKRSEFINIPMKNLHNHHNSHWRVFTPFCQHWLMQSPWLSSFCSRVPFAAAVTSFSSQTGHVLQVHVWVRFSLHNLRNHKSCASQLSCLHHNGFWIQVQRGHLVWSFTFWLVFPEFLS